MAKARLLSRLPALALISLGFVGIGNKASAQTITAFDIKTVPENYRLVNDPVIWDSVSVENVTTYSWGNASSLG